MEVKPNHINLNSREDSQNIAFMRELYAEDMDRWFDTLDCRKSWAREIDESMNIREFISLVKKPYHITLQVKWHQREEIRYSAILTDARAEKVERFLWVECPFDLRNYLIVDGIFRRAYGQGIESVPSPFDS